MILRNYYNMLTAIILGNRNGYVNNPVGPGSLMIHNYNNQKMGWAAVSSYFDSEDASLALITSVGDGGIVFGTGTKPVSFDDQSLEKKYTDLSGSSCSTTKPVYNPDTGKFEVTFSCVLAHSGASEVTLTEVGIAKTLYYTTGGNSTYTGVLVYREILDTPITLGVGEAVSYSHKFEVAIPEIS